MPIESQKKILGLRPNVFWLGLVSLLNDFSSELIYSVMPAFLTAVLGAPPILVGFIEGFADALASVLKIYSGWFSDKIRKRKILAVTGYTISTATRWFLALVANFWQVFILRAIDRVGKGLRDSPRDALISESVEVKELGKSFGYHRAMDGVGSALGPLCAVLLLPLILNDYRLLFKIGFVVGILSVLTFIFVKDVKKEKTSEPEEPHPPFSFSLRDYSHNFKVYIAAVFVFGLGVMPLALLLLKAQELGLNSYAIPLMYFIYNLSFIIFAIPAGKLADRLGDKKIIAGGFLAAVLAYLELAFFATVPAVILGFILFGIYSAMTDGVERAFAAKLVSSDKIATGQGFLNAAVGISSLLAGLVGGAIWTQFGSNTALLYGAAMMVVGLLTFIHLNRHQNNV
ncbi:MAG: MFS transporter [Candidatus Harrisonbacteria bacterium]|nr:MFS transporter [Candidatus Harrisonbacteria bacterium]